MRRLLALSLLAFAGCPSETLDDVRAKRRPGVEATFGALRALAAELATVPRVEQPALAATPVKVDLRTNAAFIHAEDLPSPGDAKALPVRTFDAQTLLHCGALLSKGTFFEPLNPRVNVRAADAALGRCVDLRYALVIRGATYDAPTADETARTFAPGTFAGDVLVVDLAAKRVLGGFPFSVTNERTLQVPEGEPQLARLARNLESLLYTQLRERLEGLAPGAVPASPL